MMTEAIRLGLMRKKATERKGQMISHDNAYRLYGPQRRLSPASCGSDFGVVEGR
jgi:hypothetical protein